MFSQYGQVLPAPFLSGWRDFTGTGSTTGVTERLILTAVNPSKGTYNFNTNILYFLSIGKGIVSNEPSQTCAIFTVKRKIEKVEKQEILSDTTNTCKSQAVVLLTVSPPPPPPNYVEHAVRR